MNGKQYNFELSDEDIKTQTLIKYGNVYAQVYVDQQSNRIMGIRYLDKELLAFIKPYQLTDEEDISDDKFNNDRNNKNSLPYEQNPNQLITLYEITNQMRDLKHIPPLKVNSDISHIASQTYMKQLVQKMLNLQKVHLRANLITKILIL